MASDPTTSRRSTDTGKVSAKVRGLSWLHEGKFVVQGPPEPGDLLYCSTGTAGFGHVGIF